MMKVIEHLRSDRRSKHVIGSDRTSKDVMESDRRSREQSGTSPDCDRHLEESRAWPDQSENAERVLTKN
jgi:hypothetical protein